MEQFISNLPNWVLIASFALLTLVIITLIYIILSGDREVRIGKLVIGAKQKADIHATKIGDEEDDRVKWNALEKEILKFREKLIADQFIPTLIVGIGRGGAVVGALISGVLGSIPLVVIDRIYKWDKHGRKDKMLFENIDLSNYIDKVLIVAGELHTGNTAKLYYNYFQKIGSNDIRIYTFYKEKYPAFEPDYFSIEGDKPDIRLPWMISKHYKRQSLRNEENAKN